MAAIDAGQGITIFTDIGTQLEQLTDAQAGRVFKALLVYANTGEIQKLGKMENMVLSMLVNQVERSREWKRKRSEVNRANANKRWGVKGDAIACDAMQTDASYPIPSYPNQSKPYNARTRASRKGGPDPLEQIDGYVPMKKEEE